MKIINHIQVDMDKNVEVLPLFKQDEIVNFIKAQTEVLPNFVVFSDKSDDDNDNLQKLLYCDYWTLEKEESYFKIPPFDTLPKRKKNEKEWRKISFFYSWWWCFSHPDHKFYSC